MHAAAAEESKGDLENPDSSLSKPTKDEKKVALSTTTLHTLPKQLPTAEHLLEAHQRGTMVSEPLRTAKEVAQLMQARSISAGAYLPRLVLMPSNCCVDDLDHGYCIRFHFPY